ncbi:MAG: phosphate acyltransferase PlsX [Ruminococcaceae bacterium]|nr:phosphate acyltransferase PlsX [Oscillospiraceae bacterium]
MRIIVDVMSGDNAPFETLLGVCEAAACDYARDVDFTLVGDENVIKKLACENKWDISKFDVRHTDMVLDMHDEPMSVMKEKNDSSLALGLRMLARGEGDAFVSCGNTGALFCGSTLIVKRVKGIQRAAIGAILPLSKPFILMDSGASVKVNEDYIHQFAIMGSAYMRSIYGIESPRVALVNNGAEETKGGELQLAAYGKLKESELINFIGNVEGNQLAFAGCDVALTDGFVGNIVLKSIEGMGKLMSAELKAMFKSGLSGAIAYLLLKKQLKNFKTKFDSAEHGGAPILGISKTVIKAHGSSKAKAFRNAIRQAIACEREGVVSIIEQEAQKLSEKKKREKQA